MNGRFYPSKSWLALRADLQNADALIEAAVCRHGDFSPSRDLIVMTQILEDRRFLRHSGFDWKSGIRILVQSIVGRRRGGASTIDMQLVRTVTEYRERSIRRKVFEILAARRTRRRHGPRRILSTYLAMAYFGTRIRGAEEAARLCFNRGADELTLDQSAYVAAMLVYPRPRQPSEAWQSRIQRRVRHGLSWARALPPATLSSMEIPPATGAGPTLGS